LARFNLGWIGKHGWGNVSGRLRWTAVSAGARRRFAVTPAGSVRCRCNCKGVSHPLPDSLEETLIHWQMQRSTHLGPAFQASRLNLLRSNPPPVPLVSLFRCLVIHICHLFSLVGYASDSTYLGPELLK
jgi:hypothetical protein